MNMKRILALDYGRKHIGIAFTESQIPQPLNSIKYNNITERTQLMKQLMQKIHPEEIVVGMPEGILEDEVLEFSQGLKNYRLPIIHWPETLTTHDAIEKLRKIGAKKSKLKNEHSYAAALILEDYLDAHSNI